MMETPLLTPSLIEYAAAYHGGTGIVSRSAAGAIHRTTYAETIVRIRKLANALAGLGVKPGDRVATLAWNSHRHLELYYAVSGMGAVCHTINPRLFHSQIEYIINHAGDRFIFVDPLCAEGLATLQGRLPKVEEYGILCGEADMPETSLPNAICYETLIGGQPNRYDWPPLDENTAAALCYTSGTTGEPKGTLYSHRSLVLHAFSICSADAALALSCRDSVLVAVPMFHVHAWGIPWGAAMCGAKMVMPGPHMDGKGLYDLMEDEQVTLSAAVPTVWQGLLDYLEESGNTLTHLKCVNIGGAAPPLAMIKAFEETHGIEAVHAWGMTETTPIGTTGRLLPRIDALPNEERYQYKQKQGRAIYGVEMKIVDDDGVPLPHDGRAAGPLMVRGPWIAAAYFDNEDASAAAIDGDGWFKTGDVATIDGDGHMNITDRAKDLIKSGGEWISSIGLENAAMAHPGVAEAAAIAMAHPKWGERPLLVVVARNKAAVTADDLCAFLAGKVPKWWLPDEVVFVEDLPHTATGKLHKLKLRQRFAGHASSPGGAGVDRGGRG